MKGRPSSKRSLLTVKLGHVQEPMTTLRKKKNKEQDETNTYSKKKKKKKPDI